MSGAGPRTAAESAGRRAIELDAVTLARDGRVVLRGVDLSIDGGEFIGIFGPNGAGKTTLLHAILGLLRPASGAVRVLGRAPRDAQGDVGYLPQRRGRVSDIHLCARDFIGSAVDGRRWGPPHVTAAAKAEVARVLELVDAAALAERPVAQLSGGELQRLLIAQALIGEPRVLLLDEPLASLDPRFQQAVVALIKRVQQSLGITVLFTAHDLNPLLGAMDRVLYLGQGQAVLGSVDEVMTSATLTRLYGAPIEVVRLHERIVVLSGHGAEVDGHDCDA
ncbi:MAG TPA: ABC transporter ATP-binding protein [Casimicrobiaceae bacterium]|nr:ABC transporter ATP-binding protein [Casimicrobiaceae bacterium]